jgi:hypothetical protein
MSLNTIPATLAPFFQEYNLQQLDPQRDAATIIERALQFGNRAEIRWLFAQYSRIQIVDWIEQFGKARLPQPHLDFWRMLLEINA